MKLHKSLLILAVCSLSQLAWSQAHISVSDPQSWTTSQLAAYVGQTVIFDVPVVVCNNYSGLKVSVHRTFSPTNQARPRSDEYNSLLSLDGRTEFYLNGISGYHRMGETIVGLTAKVNSINSLNYISGTFVGNTRADLESGPDMRIIDPNNERNLLVAAMNLEYYLAYQFDPKSSMGPDSEADHERQREKTISALSTINADIYGLVEIQCGDSALREIVRFLNDRLPERQYTYVASGTSAKGTYTQSAYIYDSKMVETRGARIDIDAEVANRKKMQRFVLKSNGEEFIYSLNHFKAKSGTGTGLNADQGDGQGVFNHRRVKEAEAVLDQYRKLSVQANEKDILIMGDLNAYAMEDPIHTLTSGGMTDLHRYFHADSSYSYVFHGQAGYLDHALASNSMLAQVTGMTAFHINSDEDDRYTYDGSWSDNTMFRSSDHDPVIVGLKLDRSATISEGVTVNTLEVMINNGDIIIRNAQRTNTPAYYTFYTITGMPIESHPIHTNAETITRPQEAGVYILMVYAEGQTFAKKVIVE